MEEVGIYCLSRPYAAVPPTRFIVTFAMEAGRMMITAEGMTDETALVFSLLSLP